MYTDIQGMPRNLSIFYRNKIVCHDMELSIANTGVKDLLVQRMRGDNKITNSIINDYGCSIHSIEIFICKRKETNLE